MRVLRVLSSLDPETGGPASVFSAAVVSVFGADVDIECLTLRPGDKDITRFPDYERMIARGIKVHAFSGVARGALYLLRSARTFDVVHVDGCWQSLCILAVLFAKISGRATVVSPHESLTREELRRTRSSFRLTIKRLLRQYYRVAADCIVYSSNLELRDSLAHANATVIPHPVFDDGKGQPAVPLRHGLSNSGTIRFGYLGRFHSKKKVETIVEAVLDTPDIELALAGTGPKDYEERLRAVAQDDDRIQWLGFVRRQDKEDFFRSIDFLVLASEYECFGMAAAEALVRGIPVIVSEKVGIADDVREIGGGFVVEGNAGRLSETFGRCARLEPRRYHELQQGALLAAELYSFGRHANAQLGVYAALLKPHHVRIAG
ncbi:glycosyltransferase [Bradyrhizobium sp. WSM3983]|uniref:glycosyltransferase n=1 Tax=Bradyrhizobium sp. WSM3983 TaxID=1038867 RepID=UPI000A0222D6|nr:glycosyltransferase [Bradyrhizobium sp. WSM3983]